jgi:hypothetical protein
MASALTVRGALRESDLVPIARYTAWHRSWNLKLMLAVSSLLIVGGVGALATGQLPNGIVPIVLGSLYATYLLSSPKLTVRKQLKASPQITQESLYEFDETEFSITRPSLRVAMPWADIHSVVERPHAYAIFTTKAAFFAVPKRFFTPEQLAEFRALLARRA